MVSEIIVGTAVANLILRDDGFYSALQGAQSALGTFASSTADTFSNISRYTGSWGTTLTRDITLPLVSMAKSALQVGSDFEEAMSQVRATMQLTEESTTQLSREVLESTGVFARFKGDLDKTTDGYYYTSQVLSELARQLGRETKFTALEAADAINVLAMAGYDVNEIILALPETLSLASAGAMGIAEAADYATGIMAGFGLAAGEMNEVSNRLAAMASNAKGSVSTFGEAMAKAAGPANTYHQSINDVSVALAILGNHNVEAAEAGNVLSRVMTRLYAPTNEAKSALEALGVEVFDMATGEARRLPDVLADLNNAMSNLTEQDYAAKMKTIFGQIAMRQAPFLLNDVTVAWEDLDKAINNSFGTVDLSSKQMRNMVKDLKSNFKAMEGDAEKFQREMKEYLHIEYNLSDAASEEVIERFIDNMKRGKDSVTALQSALSGISGAAGQMAERQLDNLSGDVYILKSALDELRISLFENVDSPLRKVVQSLTDFVNMLNDMTDAQRNLVIEIGVVAAAIGPVLLVVSKITGTVAKLLDIFSMIVSLNPALLVVIGTIGMLAVGFKEAYESSQDFRDLCDEMVRKLQDLGGMFLEFAGYVQERFQPVWDAFKETAKEIVADDVFPMLNGLLDTAKTVFGQWEPVLKDVVDLLAELAKDYLLPAIKETISLICDLITDHLDDLEEVSGILADIAKETVLPFIKAVLDDIKTVLEAAMPYIETIIGLVTDIFVEILKDASRYVKGISDAINEVDWSNLSDTLSEFDELLPDIAENLQEASEAMDIIAADTEEWFQSFEAQKHFEAIRLKVQGVANMFAALGDSILLAIYDTKLFWAMLTYDTEAIDTYSAKIDQLTDKYNNDWAAACDNVAEASRIMNNDVSADLIASQAVWSDTSGNAVINLGDMKKAMDQFSANVSAQTYNIKGDMDGFQSSVQETVERISAGSEDASDSFGRLSKNARDDLRKVEEGSTSLRDTIKKNNQDVEVSAIDLNSLIHDESDSALSKVSSAVEEMTGYSKDMEYNSTNLGDKIVELGENYGKSTQYMEDATAKLDKNSSADISNLSNNMDDFLSSTQSVMSGIRQDLGDTGEKTDEFADGVIKDFEDIADTENYGRDAISNLQSGMEEEEGSLKRWLSDLSGWISDKISSIRNGFGSLRDAREDYDGSHAAGLSYVPYNGYIAQLHEGERVLTKQENREYSSGRASAGGDTFNFYNTQPDPYEYARQMKRAKKELLLT